MFKCSLDIEGSQLPSGYIEADVEAQKRVVELV